MIDKAIGWLAGLVVLLALTTLVAHLASKESRVVGKVMVAGKPQLILHTTDWIFGHRDLKPYLRECDQWEYDTLSVPELVIPNPTH